MERACSRDFRFPNVGCKRLATAVGRPRTATTPQASRYDGHMHRLVVAAVLAFAVAGCGLVAVQDRPPVPPGQLGPIVQAEGGGPMIECRGVPLEQCRGFGNTGQPDVIRYIVTCTTVCTPQKGDVRIDILGSNGTTRPAGEGSYSSGEAVSSLGTWWTPV